MNAGYAYTIAELRAAIAANTSPNTCSLTHAGDSAPAHKEPVVAALPGDAADFDGTRSLLHERGPDRVWHTAAVGTLA
ncbi:MAG: hypothetical protein ACRD3R_05510 [Terriglobales bacterium]